MTTTKKVGKSKMSSSCWWLQSVRKSCLLNQWNFSIYCTVSSSFSDHHSSFLNITQALSRFRKLLGSSRAAWKTISTLPRKSLEWQHMATGELWSINKVSVKAQLSCQVPCSMDLYIKQSYVNLNSNIIYIYAQWPPQALHFGINLLRISTDSKNNNHQHH